MTYSRKYKTCFFRMRLFHLLWDFFDPKEKINHYYFMEEISLYWI